MPIFYLEPREGDISHKRWAATTLKEGCWISAPSEEYARRWVQQATIKLIDFQPDTPLVYSPWLDSQFTECRFATPDFDVPETAVVASTVELHSPALKSLRSRELETVLQIFRPREAGQSSF